MGSAASALLKDVEQATPEELKAAASALTAEEHARVRAAFAHLHTSLQTDASVGPVVAAAGENEDGVDAALAAELAEQEKMFLKCLRKRAEREAKKKLEKEERKAAAKKLKDKAMEAAFDNELDDLLKMMDEGVEPECSDEHGTTLLSEACAGNAKEVAEMLIGEGCDPNSVGRYRRTPLWRAAYAGNQELIRQLLRSGGDPRECDEQGARPIDVASNAESREYLVCWDPASTDRIKEDKRKAAKNAEKEEKAKFKRQQQELVDSLEESERRMQVSKSELARARKLLVDYRQQKVSFVEQGAQEKLAELEPLIESAEVQVKLFEGSVQEWEWKASRARLKMNDLEQAKKEKEAKAAGKLRGFKVQISCASLDELESLLPRLAPTLEVDEDFAWSDIDLVKGDALIKDGAFSHLKASEFNKQFLQSYGRPSQDEVTEASQAEEGAEKEEPFPLTLNFSRGFNRTVPIKAISDVLLKDVGGLRAEDGRWPFVIDPSGRTSTFIKYSGAAVFNIVELKDMEPLRLRRAFLNSLIHGGALLVDLGSFDTKIDVVADKFNDLEKGLFAKLLDRAVLYAYLLPRRFKSLIVKEIAQDFQISAFMDEALSKFVFGFVTSFRDPDLDFAKQSASARRGANLDMSPVLPTGLPCATDATPANNMVFYGGPPAPSCREAALAAAKQSLVGAHGIKKPSRVVRAKTISRMDRISPEPSGDGDLVLQGHDPRRFSNNRDVRQAIPEVAPTTAEASPDAGAPAIGSFLGWAPLLVSGQSANPFCPAESAEAPWEEEDWSASEAAGSEAEFDYRQYRYREVLARKEVPETGARRRIRRGNRSAHTEATSDDDGINAVNAWPLSDGQSELCIASWGRLLSDGEDNVEVACDEELQRVASVLIQFYGLCHKAVKFKGSVPNVLIVSQEAWRCRERRDSQAEEPPVLWIRGGRVYDFHGDRGTVAEFENDLLVRQVEDDAICRQRRQKQGLMPFPFAALPIKEKVVEEPDDPEPAAGRDVRRRV